MDGKIYYQPIAIDTEAGTYKAAEGWPARKFQTLWEAEDACAEIAKGAQGIPPHIHLGVQEVRSTPMPGHKPVADYKQGA